MTQRHRSHDGYEVEQIRHSVVCLSRLPGRAFLVRLAFPRYARWPCSSHEYPDMIRCHRCGCVKSEVGLLHEPAGALRVANDVSALGAAFDAPGGQFPEFGGKLQRIVGVMATGLDMYRTMRYVFTLSPKNCLDC